MLVAILTALAVEKNVMFYLLIFIVIVAAFGIMNSQITFVVQKTREIGVLKALGARVTVSSASETGLKVWMEGGGQIELAWPQVQAADWRSLSAAMAEAQGLPARALPPPLPRRQPSGVRSMAAPMRLFSGCWTTTMSG